MLPDFPRVKQHIRDTSSRLVRELIKKHPTLGQIRTRHVFEGNRTAIQDATSKRDTPLERVGISVPLDRRTIIEKGEAAVFEQVPVIAAQMIDSQVEMLRRGVDAAVEHAGNAVHAAGRPFSQDLYLEMLHKVQLQFDDDGRPSIPSLFHPDPAFQARMEARLSEWMQDPTFRDRIEAAITKQRQDWNDRESNRKLVD